MRAAILSSPFRPFFMLAALHGAGGIVAWIAFLVHGASLPAAGDPFLWHGHMMVTGFAGAIIAGFLLTAASNWTQQATTNAGSLSLLVALWLVGRVSDYMASVPDLAALIADVGFWLLLDILLLRVILIRKNWRNLGFAILPLLFGFVDLAWHAEQVGATTNLARPALWAAVDLLTVIMGAMGGRIIPFFTHNRLPSAKVRTSAPLGMLTNVALVAVLLVNLVFRGEPVAAVAMMIAGALVIARLSMWDGFATRREPMLWILHLGYAWLGIALLLRALAVLSSILPESTAIHATPVGALGALGLGMLVRVALGHTGRPIVADRLVIAMFLLVSLAAVARLTTPFGVSPTVVYAVSGCLWALAFLFYLWRFIPILVTERK